MPRATTDDLKNFLTTPSVAESLGMSPYLIKARIADGTLPPASRTSAAGVLLFDDAWLAAARTAQHASPALARRRRRGARNEHRAPRPDRVFGHVPGEAGWLPTWPEVVGYFRELAAASERVVVEDLGTSTDGAPYIAVLVSAPENLLPSARQRNREMLGRLWDPRGLTDDESESLVDEARTTNVILASQHSNEIGATLMTTQIAHHLASSTSPDVLDVLASTVTVLIPSHNPDGITMIADWYRRWVGTEYDGSEIPWLYHPYVGHDNNRDWFMLTQAETRHYVALHNREHPQAVFDMHQMGPYGPRFMVPPFIDPLDPNQDPVIQQGFAALGSHIAQRLTAAGKAGVITAAIFDNYSPSLAYGNYHGSVDLLSEAASARLATPIEIREKQLNDDYGVDPRVRGWNHPLPWKGGTWTLAEIVEYDLIAALAFLEHLARNRAQWLRDYLGISRRAIARTERPYGFIIPPEQRDPAVTRELVETLERGLTEVEEAVTEIELDGVRHPPGTLLIRLEQPAGAFAKTLLEVQRYPDLREYPGGPPRRPYDIAGHTLPIQMGIHALPIDNPIPAGLATRRIDLASSPVPPIPDRSTLPGADGWAIDARSNAAIPIVHALLARNVPLRRASAADPGSGVRAGDLLFAAEHMADTDIEELVDRCRGRARPVANVAAIAGRCQRPVRLGIYRPWTACIDEGWARWVVESNGLAYETLRNADLRQGGLIDRVDTILIPEMTPHDLREGRPERTKDDYPYPPEYVGGLGGAGFEGLRAFVEAGGTLIAIDRSSRAIIDALALPVRNPLVDIKDDEFYCPGSLLRVVVDTAHPVGYGLPRESAVLFMQSLAFESSSEAATIPLRYPNSDPNLSGWLLGGRHLEGRGALAEVAYEAGRVILFGFRPYFRAQTRGTYRLFFNAIWRSGLGD